MLNIMLGNNVCGGFSCPTTCGTKLPLLCLLVVLLLAACGDNVSRENFARIANNMSQDEVFEILGEPDKLNSIELGELSGGTARWRNDKQQITVTFAGGKVAFKTYGTRGNDE